MPRLLLETDFVEEDVRVQEEPALEIALPQVFTQPPLSTLQRGKLPHVERLAARLSQLHAEQNGASLLGPDYQALVNEFQPLFTWTIACWDYLLSIEGCRFVLRHGDEKLLARGDYRAVTDRDFSRLTHRVFRSCVIAFAHTPEAPSLPAYLRAHFWDQVLEAYRRLEDPPDLRQRKLTAYSYLRCVPYQFLNAFHHDLVTGTVQDLPPIESQTVAWYFLNFFTVDATAQRMGLPVDSVDALLRRALTSLLINDRLVYCLLRQIERY